MGEMYQPAVTLEVLESSVFRNGTLSTTAKEVSADTRSDQPEAVEVNRTSMSAV